MRRQLGASFEIARNTAVICDRESTFAPPQRWLHTKRRGLYVRPVNRGSSKENRSDVVTKQGAESNSLGSQLYCSVIRKPLWTKHFIFAILCAESRNWSVDFPEELHRGYILKLHQPRTSDKLDCFNCAGTSRSVFTTTIYGKLQLSFSFIC